MPVSGVTSQWPLCSSTGERGSIFRTRSPQSLFFNVLMTRSMGAPLSSVPAPMVTPQWPLCSWTGERIFILRTRFLTLCLSLSLSLSSFLSVYLCLSLSLPLLLSPQDGKTPLDYARERNHTACISLLESHMGPSRVLSSLSFPSLDLSPEEKPSVCRPSLPPHLSSLQSS
jgi:hypothetical protein